MLFIMAAKVSKEAFGNSAKRKVFVASIFFRRRTKFDGHSVATRHLRCFAYFAYNDARHQLRVLFVLRHFVVPVVGVFRDYSQNTAVQKQIAVCAVDVAAVFVCRAGRRFGKYRMVFLF